MNLKAFESVQDLLNVERSLLLRFLPKTREGDHLMALIDFIRKLNRFPAGPDLWNDRLFMMKTSDELRDPLRVFVTDKEFVKIFVKSVVGDKYNVPTIAVLKTKSQVDSFSFPADCCIKPTHGSGKALMRQANERIDRESIKRWFDENYYDRTREINYRYLQPKVIVEPILFADPNLCDYKFYCADGIPRLVHVDFDRRTNHRRKVFDADWNDLGFSFHYPAYPGHLPRPTNFRAMLDLSAELARHFSYIRVDLYTNGTDIFVGELTNCPASGLSPFFPPESEAVASRILFQGTATSNTALTCASTLISPGV